MAVRRLLNTAAALKGALRRVRSNQPDADAVEVDDLRGDLYELIERGQMVRASAINADLNVTRLTEAIAVAERRVTATVDGSSNEGSIPAPSMASSQTAGASNGPSRHSSANRAERPANPPEREGIREITGGRVIGGPPSTTSSSSHEEREHNLEEQQIRLDSDQEVLNARRQELARLRELEERRSQRPAPSSSSSNSVYEEVAAAAPAHPPPPPPVAPAVRPREGEWRQVRARRARNPPRYEVINNPPNRNQEWIEQAARITQRREYEEEPDSIDEEEEDDETTPQAMMAAWQVFLREQRKKRLIAKRIRELQSAADGAGTRERGQQTPATTTTRRTRLTGRPETRPRTERERGRQTDQAPVIYQSSLDTVKLMERKRPAEKFDGVAKKIDFDDHIARFLKAVNIPGLPAEWKLAEIPEWFTGVARIHVSRYLRREDAEEAFHEAIARLKEEYGQKADDAEDMLADAMSKGKIKKEDADGMNLFVAQVISAYTLAEETDRDADFHRRSLYKKIIANNLPHLKSAWATHQVKKDLKKPSFNDFILFLEEQRKIVACCQEMAGETEQQPDPKPQRGATGGLRNQGGPDWKPSYAAVAGNSRSNYYPRESRGENPTPRGPERLETNRERGAKAPPPCILCRMNHPLDFCPKFLDLTPDEKGSLVKEKNRCPKCLKGGHALDVCYAQRGCYTCGGNHHSLIHEAMTEATRQEAGTRAPDQA